MKLGAVKGLEIKAIIAAELPFINHLSNIEKYPFNSKLKVHDVTKGISGMYIKILRYFESELNFTTKIFKRKHDKWGIPIVHENGTIESSGMILDLKMKTFDLIVTSLAQVLERSYVIDYLHPLTQTFGAFFIKRGVMKENYDFYVFTHPFQILTWISISILINIIVIILIFFSKGPKKSNITKGFIKTLLNTSMAFFGQFSLNSCLNKFGSTRGVLFVTAITGNIVWMFYNATLTSELIEPNIVKPFNDFETFLQSGYR